MNKLPELRTNLVTQKVGDELLVYDRSSQVCHQLNGPATQLFELCRQKATYDAAIAVLGSSELVQLGLKDLEELLVDELPSLNRRQILKRLAVAPAALPIVMSLLTPEAAMAGSIGCANCIGTSNSCPACPAAVGPGGPCTVCQGTLRNCASLECCCLQQITAQVGQTTCAGDIGAGGGGISVCANIAMPLPLSVNQDCAVARANLGVGGTFEDCDGNFIAVAGNQYYCCQNC